MVCFSLPGRSAHRWGRSFWTVILMGVRSQIDKTSYLGWGVAVLATLVLWDLASAGELRR